MSTAQDDGLDLLLSGSSDFKKVQKFNFLAPFCKSNLPEQWSPDETKNWLWRAIAEEAYAKKPARAVELFHPNFLRGTPLAQQRKLTINAIVKFGLNARSDFYTFMAQYKLVAIGWLKEHGRVRGVYRVRTKNSARKQASIIEANIEGVHAALTPLLAQIGALLGVDVNLTQLIPMGLAAPTPTSPAPAAQAADSEESTVDPI
jgi:hypothetical protein